MSYWWNTISEETTNADKLPTQGRRSGNFDIPRVHIHTIELEKVWDKHLVKEVGDFLASGVHRTTIPNKLVHEMVEMVDLINRNTLEDEEMVFTDAIVGRDHQALLVQNGAILAGLRHGISQLLGKLEFDDVFQRRSLVQFKSIVGRTMGNSIIHHTSINVTFDLTRQLGRAFFLG